ncbi:MAG: hypothetical protein KKD01_01300 [Proteobacteria bacterium]|nr:hypothetical protein [Pseudomonadota bacterium]MBU1418260.1 hypothetical protein [Pseudomonadota bacterium]MBU1453336.1 hypothetical protein [Pseudomonadota bacterium]
MLSEIKKVNIKNILLLSAANVLFFSIILFIYTDQNNIDRDYKNLRQLILETNNQAITKKIVLELKFNNNKAIVVNRNTNNIFRQIRIPTFCKINYKTTEGPGKIIFTEHGTDPYNIFLHGGDILLKTWFGEERSLWIHCTGFPNEGKMTDFTKRKGADLEI